MLADDHPMYRYGVAAVLRQSGVIDVVAEVADGSALPAAVAQHAPDVVVTDLCIPGLGGAAAIERLHQQDPAVRVLVLTMHDGDANGFAALRAARRASGRPAESARALAAAAA